MPVGEPHPLAQGLRTQSRALRDPHTHTHARARARTHARHRLDSTPRRANPLEQPHEKAPHGPPRRSLPLAYPSFDSSPHSSPPHSSPLARSPSPADPAATPFTSPMTPPLDGDLVDEDPLSISHGSSHTSLDGSSGSVSSEKLRESSRPRADGSERPLESSADSPGAFRDGRR